MQSTCSVSSKHISPLQRPQSISSLPLSRFCSPCHSLHHTPPHYTVYPCVPSRHVLTLPSRRWAEVAAVDPGQQRRSGPARAGDLRPSPTRSPFLNAAFSHHHRRRTRVPARARASVCEWTRPGRFHRPTVALASSHAEEPAPRRSAARVTESVTVRVTRDARRSPHAPRPRTPVRRGVSTGPSSGRPPREPAVPSRPVQIAGAAVK